VSGSGELVCSLSLLIRGTQRARSQAETTYRLVQILEAGSQFHHWKKLGGMPRYQPILTKFAGQEGSGLYDVCAFAGMRALNKAEP
jgi:hypothetical protein